MTTVRMLTLTQLAEHWNVDPKVIYGLRYRGEAPPAIRVGRELRFALDDVAEWEKARRDSGGPRAVALLPGMKVNPNATRSGSRERPDDPVTGITEVKHRIPEEPS